MFLWIVIGVVVVLALLAWGARRGTAGSSDPHVKNVNRDHGYDGYQ